MNTLVETLETQHRALERLVAEVFAALKAGDAAAIPEPLGKLDRLLTQHFNLEQAQFYPTLNELAATDPAISTVAQAFATNMQTIAGGLLGFFKRHRGPIDLATFAPDWKKTVEILSRRLVDEEKTLHPLFDRLTAAEAKAH
ncbi:MAG: hemerythrin domain-containing protein [Deltaproteobacteria bacterium]|nr:hemerythrin domain-containing protein [Deltaproteobacteria bacterium]